MPLTEQLSQVNPIQGRNISPGTDNSLASGLSGLAGLAGAISSASARGRANRMEEARLELAQNRDEREQETHDLAMAEARREQQFVAVENEYRSQRRRLQSALEAGAVSEEGYDLQLRNLINKTHARNPGYAEELDTLVTTLGDTGVAFTQSEMIAAQEQAEIAGQAQIREGLNREAIARGFGNMDNSNGQRDAATAAVLRAEQETLAAVRQLELTALIRQEDAAQAQADRAVQVQEHRTSVNNVFRNTLGAHLQALTIESRTMEPGDLETQQGLRTDTDLLLSAIEETRFAQLEAANGNPDLEANINQVADEYTAQVAALEEVYGERGARLAADLQANFANEIGQSSAVAALTQLNELGIDAETLMDRPDLGGAELVRVAIGDLTDAQNRLFTLENGGPMPIDDPEEYREVALESVGMTARTANYINAAPTQDRETADQFTAGVTVQSRYASTFSAEGGVSFQAAQGFSNSLANPETISAVRNLMADPETAEHGRAAALSVRAGLYDLLALERGRIRDGSLSMQAGAGGSNINIPGGVSIDPETGYMRVPQGAERTVGRGADRTSRLQVQEVNRQLRLARQYADNYNSILDALVETSDLESPDLAALPADVARVAYSTMNSSEMGMEILSYQQQQEMVAAQRAQAIVDMAQQGQLNPDGSTSPTPVSGRGDRSTGVPPGEARDAGTQQSVVPGQGGSEKGPFNKASSTSKEEAESDDGQRIDAEILELIGFNRAPPNVTAAALSYTDESNTYVDDRGPEWTVAGTYWPLQGGSERTANTINRIFEGRSDMFGPGTLNSARSGSTLAHELVHRLFDVRPVNPDEGFEQAVREYVEYAGGSVPEGFDFTRLLRTNAADGLATEQLPHLLRGFVRSPDRIRGFFGIGDRAERFPRPEITDRPRLTMPSDYDLERARERGALNPEYDQRRDRERALRSAVLKNLDRLYLEQMTDADWERIDRDHPAARETGRGRPTSD